MNTDHHWQQTRARACLGQENIQHMFGVRVPRIRMDKACVHFGSKELLDLFAEFGTGFVSWAEAQVMS